MRLQNHVAEELAEIETGLLLYDLEKLGDIYQVILTDPPTHHTLNEIARHLQSHVFTKHARFQVAVDAAMKMECDRDETSEVLTGTCPLYG